MQHSEKVKTQSVQRPQHNQPKEGHLLLWVGCLPSPGIAIIIIIIIIIIITNVIGRALWQRNIYLIK